MLCLPLLRALNQKTDLLGLGDMSHWMSNAKKSLCCRDLVGPSPGSDDEVQEVLPPLHAQSALHCFTGAALPSRRSNGLHDGGHMVVAL